MKVVVLSGGRSSEHEISLRSGASVAEGLAAAGHDALPVIIGRDGRWKQGESEVELLPGGGLLGADAAFPVLHGPFGEDGTVQGLLESLDVPYVGCDVLSSALCMDKLTFKRLLGYHGTPQVEFVQVGEPDWRRRAEQMGLPLWVKPARLGSSVGITKVGSAESELDEAIEAAAAHDPRVIIEASANAREVECSVLGNEDPETSQPGEIVADADWYDYESKYSEGGMELVVPAPVGEEAVAAVRALAAEVFAFCGCSGLARCDFFVTEQGQVLVNELNTIPGFTETSVYSKLWEESGVAYPQLCDRLVGLGIERFRASRGFEY